MDALKLIEQGSMKAEAPKIEIGDLVKVHVKIKEGEKFRIQRVPLSLRSTAESTRLSPLDV